MTSYTDLPADLPRPVDDGACDHLRGLRLPEIELSSTQGSRSLSNTDSTWLVLYVYPSTGGKGVDLPDDWDLIPGARGCTPQSCEFRDHHQELAAIDATVYGLSSQPLEQQIEFAERMHIPFPLLNDSGLTLSRPPLALPTFNVDEVTRYRRVTLVARQGAIEKVFYPVFPPDRNAAEVMEFLRSEEARE